MTSTRARVHVAFTKPHTMLVLAFGLAAGCMPHESLHDLRGDDDHVHPDDVVLGHNASHAMQGLAVDGPWIVPAEIEAIGDLQDVPLNDAPPYNGGDNCSCGPTD